MIYTFILSFDNEDVSIYADKLAFGNKKFIIYLLIFIFFILHVD